jgi:hypothetical protein
VQEIGRRMVNTIVMEPSYDCNHRCTRNTYAENFRLEVGWNGIYQRPRISFHSAATYKAQTSHQTQCHQVCMIAMLGMYR